MDLQHPLRILLGSTAPLCEFYLDLLHPLRILFGSTALRCEFYLDLLHPRVNSTWIYCAPCEFYLVLLHHPREWGRRLTSKGAPSGLWVGPGDPPAPPGGGADALQAKPHAPPRMGIDALQAKGPAGASREGLGKGVPPVRASKTQKIIHVSGIYTRTRPATKIWLNQI